MPGRRERRGRAPLQREGGVDGVSEQEGRKDDRRVHDDAGERTEYERTGDLPEIRPQFP